MSNSSNSNYGSAWSCVSDLTMPAVMVGGKRAVAEAIARRLISPRGSNAGDPNYGYDCSQYVDADLSTADLSLMQSNIDAECVKDERVLSATSTVTLTAAGLLTIKVVLTLATGPFTLVLAVSDVTATILQAQ